MKQLLTLFLLLFTATCFAQGRKVPQAKKMKSIVVYFSHTGMNYVDGDIVSLKVGNTKLLAEKIQKQTGCDEFEIVPVKAYPDDYKKCCDVAKEELNKKARPGYKGNVDLSQYETIYIGYPIWCGTMPMCVFKFIEDHHCFAGKTVKPFSTHEGSGLGNSVDDIRKLCPKAKVRNGVAIKGSNAKTAKVDRIINQ